jgi:hypothetical protein
MGLRAKYDLSEDRMHLTLQWGEGAEQQFWVTRRIWLGLLFALNNLPPEVLSETPISTKPLIPSGHKPEVKPVSEAPQIIKNIHLRHFKSGTKLIFSLVSVPGLSLDLSSQALLQLKTLVHQQAASAGWDVDAFQARLSSAQMAQAAVQKARWQ